MKCEYCDGTGMHPDPSEEEIKQYFILGDPQPIQCPNCLGSGNEIDWNEYDRKFGIR